MRVRVDYTVDVDDGFRRAVNEWYGRPGLATRAEVRRWYEANGHSMDDDLADAAASVGQARGARDPWGDDGWERR